MREVKENARGAAVLDGVAFNLGRTRDRADEGDLRVTQFDRRLRGYVRGVVPNVVLPVQRPATGGGSVQVDAKTSRVVLPAAW